MNPEEPRKSLRGARVALLEARMSGEAAALVERLGGVPYSVPAVRETPIHNPAEAAAFLDLLEAGRFDVVVFLTGVGVSALLREAEQRGRLERTLAALARTTTACRGPKPAGVLRRQGVQVGVSAAEPYTTRELLDALQAIDVAGRRVGLLHYGERSGALAEALAARGALVDELCLYEWRLPDDVSGLERLVGEIVGGKVDAIAFTSQIQARHLFRVAASIDRAPALAAALNTTVVVAAVGPVSAAALRELGVVPRVLPPHPKMGSMMIALADYFDLTDRRA